jgi:hypothetical protein
MIITTQKSFEEVMKYLEPYSNVLIVGCGTCATEVQTGGEKQIKELADKLRGKWFVKTMMIEAPCDERLARRDWRKIKKSDKDIDALLILGCGAGVQTLSDVVDLPCFPGLETHFLGKVERIGLYYERCKACGECHLGETAGICPVTRCAKGLLNGPCGGMMHGNCEVGGYVRECAWVTIYERLKKQGRMELFRKIRPPKQFGLQAYPRGIDAIPSHMKIKKNPLFGPNETEETVMKAVRESNSKH